jgi:hypothetical protein
VEGELNSKAARRQSQEASALRCTTSGKVNQSLGSGAGEGLFSHQEEIRPLAHHDPSPNTAAGIQGAFPGQTCPFAPDPAGG